GRQHRPELEHIVLARGRTGRRCVDRRQQVRREDHLIRPALGDLPPLAIQHQPAEDHHNHRLEQALEQFHADELEDAPGIDLWELGKYRRSNVKQPGDHLAWSFVLGPSFASRAHEHDPRTRRHAKEGSGDAGERSLPPRTEDPRALAHSERCNAYKLSEERGATPAGMPAQGAHGLGKGSSTDRQGGQEVAAAIDRTGCAGCGKPSQSWGDFWLWYWACVIKRVSDFPSSRTPFPEEATMSP